MSAENIVIDWSVGDINCHRIVPSGEIAMEQAFGGIYLWNKSLGDISME